MPLDNNYNKPITDENIDGITAISYLAKKRGHFFTVVWNKLYKKELFSTIRFPFSKVHEDEYVAHLLFHKCSKVACISDSLYFYVQRNDSITGRGTCSTNADKLCDAIEALILRAEYLKRHRLELSGHFYFDAAMLLSYVTSYLDKNNKEKYKVILKKYRSNIILSKECALKEKLHMIAIYISPKLHAKIVKFIKGDFKK